MRALRLCPVGLVFLSAAASLQAGEPPPCVTPPSGLVAWWPGDGDATEILAANNGTTQGNVTFVAGQVGEAFNFDASNASGVLVGNPAALQLQTFTIDAWIQRGSLVIGGNGPSNEGGILVYGHDGYSMGILPDGQLFLSKVQVSNVASGASFRVTDTNLHHVAVTKSGSSVFFYIDGTASSEASYDPGFAFTTNLSIGARLDLTPPNSGPLTSTFSGRIDELEVFNRALGSGEIQAIAAAGSSGKCKPAWLDIDADGAVEPLTDGLLVLRHLFGFTGSILVTGAVDLVNCVRCNAGAIEAHLGALASELDIDDDATNQPLTDGLLVLRSRFGFTGDSLIIGAVSQTCMRCEAPAIQSYIEELSGE